jgi:His-Xaa-Ser system radical SAM maturase HxsB
MPEAQTQLPSRKFKGDQAYAAPPAARYFLMPFRFARLNEEREVLVNEVGDHLVVPAGAIDRIVRHELDKNTNTELYADLIAGHFIAESPVPPLIDVLATRYRTKKAFLDSFTTLHIFVMSLRCEHTCHYCQVSRVTEDKERYDLSRQHLDKGIEWMLRSPSPHVTMEFQGGEALLAFENIRYAVQRVESLAPAANKTATFVICSNLALLTEEMLHYCKAHDILISSSLDGPAFIHNANRTRPGRNSYELAVRGIQLAREILGPGHVSALMTTTNLSLDYPIEIVEEYYRQGFRNIFLRPISPYGFALRNERRNKYEMERFLNFYKIALNRIIDYNLAGEYFREDYASIILRKILTPFPVGYVDLNSPTGCITNVIAFNYNGAIYASDESRMLAEMKDETFRLGHLDTNNYEEVFYGEKARAIVAAGINESLPGCSDCAYQAYCGADPVHHHATQGDMHGYRPTSTFCQKNMEIIRYLIDWIDKDTRVSRIFESWVNPRK